jgi:hypothetical protein
MHQCAVCSAVPGQVPSVLFLANHRAYDSVPHERSHLRPVVGTAHHGFTYGSANGLPNDGAAAVQRCERRRGVPKHRLWRGACLCLSRTLPCLLHCTNIGAEHRFTHAIANGYTHSETDNHTHI